MRFWGSLRYACGMSTVLLVRLDPRLEAEVLRWLPHALEGDERATRRYARAWRKLVRTLSREQPDAPTSTVAVLDHFALTAPFDPEGPLRALASVATAIIPGMEVTTTVPAQGAARAADYRRFSNVVLSELADPGSGIERLVHTWHLSITDVGRLFGVSRQAVQQWLDDGVPGARRAKLAGILEIADLLERNLLPERIPGVVRTPAEAFGNLSMLEAIAVGRHVELLEHVRRSFDWAWSA